ncbi:MAG TPA: hypothetical protein VLG09_04130 [Candidatus Saccharimonadales bacterium]|nr:hypothetical protein [Candidatus Saccharimonadales bacterium]
MENAKVGIFEDTADWQDILKGIVEMNGHQVTLSITSMDAARITIPALPEDVLNVALVDGNLNTKTASGADGAEISRLLKEKFGEAITVIGCSGSHVVEGADFNASKLGNPAQEIPDIIAAI